MSHTDDAPLLEFATVTLHHPPHAYPLLLDLDFSLRAGDGLVLTGPARCGKSTVLSLALGADHESSGEVLALGYNPASLGRRELSALRARIGYLAQYGALLSNLTLHENLALPLRYHRNASPDQVSATLRRACELVELELDHLPAVLPHEVTLEYRQLVALAKALVLEPSIVLLDEPTARLTLKAAQNFWRLLEGIRAQRPIALLITAHDDTEVRAVCNQSINLPARDFDHRTFNHSG